ncbi:MAG: hypothetical protein JW955_06510 [Sedimentisphaerales bacterium]|nr:hypothetical protein [Sedimentisphaerales bacterium]
MDSIQVDHERAVGDRFIAGYNRIREASYVFERRGDADPDPNHRAPDLIYQDGDARIGIEITTCYYDSHDAKVQWQNARGLPDAPWCGSGVDFDQGLIEDINKRIQAKCGKPYRPACFLLVYINPALTTYEDMERLMPDVSIPEQHRFAGIWLVGSLGIKARSRVTDAMWELA